MTTKSITIQLPFHEIYDMAVEAEKMFPEYQEIIHDDYINGRVGTNVFSIGCLFGGKGRTLKTREDVLEYYQNDEYLRHLADKEYYTSWWDSTFKLYREVLGSHKHITGSLSFMATVPLYYLSTFNYMKEVVASKHESA